MKLGTTKTLPRFGRLDKLSSQKRKALATKVTGNPVVTVTEAQKSEGEKKALWSDETKI